MLSVTSVMEPLYVLISFLCALTIDESEGLPTFSVSFQSNGSWSTDHWMRYNEKIKGVKEEFSVCHWLKLRYFSTDISSIWSYCYIKSDSDTQIPC